MSITSNLELNKHDNPSSNTNPFDIENYLNANWNKIDQFAGDINSEITDINDDINNINTSKANRNELPTKVSDLTNDTGFITNAVNNLVNYYLKSDTYTRTEVNTLISNITKVTIQVVAELPQVGESNVIYLVPSSNPKTKNIKDEYIYVNNNWEQIGSTEIDLTGYATENWVNAQISDFLTEAQIETLVANALADYYDKDEIDELVTELEAENAELQQENKNLRKASYTLNGTGENVTLNKTSDNRFVKLDVKGNKKQDSYEGYNLFNPELAVYDCTVDKNTGLITITKDTVDTYVNGSYSSSTPTLFELESGSYKVLLTDTNIRVDFYGIYENDTTVIGVSSNTVTSLINKFLVKGIRIRSTDGTTSLLNKKLGICLCENSHTDYEPYTYGQAPNPNYECPVKAVGDDGNVNTEIVNNNWFDFSKVEEGDLNTQTGKDIAGTNVWRTSYIPVKPSTVCTIKTGNTATKRIFFYDKDKNMIYTNLFTAGVGSFTTTADTCYVRFKSVLENFASTSMLVEGSYTEETIPTYTPHEEQVYNIPCQKPMLDESDYFDRDNEQEVHEYDKKIFNGTETLIAQGELTNTIEFAIMYNNSKILGTEINCYSNFFTAYNSSELWSNDIVGIAQSETQIIFRISKDIASTVEQFKAYLAEQYANGTPVYVWYKLAETEYLPFTAEQKAVAKEIDKATSYYEQTNIFSINEVSPIYDTTAVADMNLIIDELSQAIVANGGV